MPVWLKDIAEIAAGDWVSSNMSAAVVVGFAGLLVVGFLYRLLRRLTNRPERIMSAPDLILVGVIGIFVFAGIAVAGYGLQWWGSTPTQPLMPQNASVASQQSYEAGLVERTKKFQPSEKEGFAKALVSLSSVYEQARAVSDLFNTEVHLWNVGMHNGRIGGGDLGTS